MKLTPIQWTLIKAGLALLVLGLATSVSYFSGITQGQNNITVQWQADKLKSSAALAEATNKIHQQESAHRLETARIADQLRKTEADYEKATSALAAEHADRLRLSAERAPVYTALAEAGPTERAGLASHAAELDRSLEEGRGLVGELTAALGQREAQLRLLGAQITTDRTLLDGR